MKDELWRPLEWLDFFIMSFTETTLNNDAK